MKLKFKSQDFQTDAVNFSLALPFASVLYVDIRHILGIYCNQEGVVLWQPKAQTSRLNNP